MVLGYASEFRVHAVSVFRTPCRAKYARLEIGVPDRPDAPTAYAKDGLNGSDRAAWRRYRPQRYRSACHQHAAHLGDGRRAEGEVRPSWHPDGHGAGWLYAV